MEIGSTGSLIHWNYYLALEEDLLKASRFIEFDKSNFKCFSIELAHLLLASNSEIDVVLKSLCNLFDQQAKHKNIDQYRSTIMKHIPDFSEELCSIRRYGLDLLPWGNWAEKKNPIWWRAYNDVKHHRSENFSKANLENTLNSMAGLHICLLYYYKKIWKKNKGEIDMREVYMKLNPKPSLIYLGRRYFLN